MKKYVWVMAAAVLASLSVSGPAASASAQTRIAEPDTRLLEGRCLQVRVGQEDMTNACSGTLGLSAFPDGRTSFHFLLGSNHMLTVRGTDAGTGANRGKRFKIDTVIFNTGAPGAEPDMVTAKGQCTYENRKGGVVTLRCDGALGQATKFVAAFRSAPPEAPEAGAGQGDQP